MNEKQVAFITCVNDEEEYVECRHYLERLYIPEGYSTDLISIQEAPSMTVGYNAAMKNSDAKYKVYLHQDVFIKNRNFIADILSVFAGDEQTGMLGMIGNRLSWEDPSFLMTWDTGKVADSRTVFSLRVPEKEDGYMEVQTVDGLLLVTQYDLMWREDIFDGWHFYDLAQCMEFKKAGYKVAVPWQANAWCYHDSSYPEFGQYYSYYERFVREYGERVDFPVEKKDMDSLFYKEVQDSARIQKELQRIINNFFETENRIKLRELFQNPDLQGQQFLQGYEMIVNIDWQEEKNQSFPRFWNTKMSLTQLMSKLKALKHALKRIEYGVNETGQEIDWILSNYSEYAVKCAYDRYIDVDGNNRFGI